MESIKEFRGNELAQASAVKEDLTCSSSSPLNKSDQVISGAEATAEVERAPGPGQVSSYKLQATSFKPQASSFKLQATSFKRQVKLQAASVGCGPNRQAPSMAFRDDRSEDRGSRMTHKVLLVQKRLPGL